MTALDQWKPEGEPIHPYDAYELLEHMEGWTSQTVVADVVTIVSQSPAPEDEADYLRNLHKLGTVVEIAGKKYFETTTIPAKTHQFDLYLRN